MRSVGATHRVWNNAAAQNVLSIDADPDGDQAEIFNAAAGVKAKRMYDEGELDVGVVSCGQGVGLIHEVPTVKELFDGMMAQTESIVGGLGQAIC